MTHGVLIFICLGVKFIIQSLIYTLTPAYVNLTIKKVILPSSVTLITVHTELIIETLNDNNYLRNLHD